MKTCKYCGKTFLREHLHARHEKTQCKMRSKVTTPHNYDNNIHLAKMLVLQNKQSASNSQQPSAIQKKNIEEAIKLHKNVIKLKNTNKLLTFKCPLCDEGFEFESEMVTHQQSCIYNDSDKDKDIEDLRETIKLNRREIIHLQDKIKQLEQKLLLVEQVEQQLKDLKDIELQLTLFKNATLK